MCRMFAILRLTRWSATACFVAAVACALGAEPPARGSTLFLLAGTCFLNDTSDTFPATLYTVSAQHTLRLFRTVVPGSEGTTNVLDDTQGRIYVVFPSDLAVPAPTGVSVVHERRPWESDLVGFNPNAMALWPYGVATALGSGSESYALLPLFREPPSTVKGHAAFMRYIARATTLVAVAGNPPARGPRVTKNDWDLYNHLTFSGTPGGPGYYPPPEAAVVGGNLVVRYGGRTVIVDRAPPGLAQATSGPQVRIVAATRRFVVTWLYRTSDRFAPATYHVHDRQLGRWGLVKLSSSSPDSRIFGPWLATIAMSYAGGTAWSDRNPGHDDERSGWVKDLLPNVKQQFDAMRMFSVIPGVLVLDNLADGRRITLDTHEEDSEILDVRKDGLVLYRVNDEIFSAQIQGDKLSAPTLAVKGEDVPEIHWAFWSNAPAEPAPSGKPAAGR
jgi:hypothetical protein